MRMKPIPLFALVAATLLALPLSAGGLNPTVTVGLRKATASEPGTLAAHRGGFVLIRDGSDLSKSLVVNVTLAGTATYGTDFVSGIDIGTSVVIPAGADRITLPIYPLDDTLVEGDESIFLLVTAGAGYDVGNPSTATLILQDDDNGASPAPIGD